MKKIFSFIIVVVLVLFLTSCKKKEIDWDSKTISDVVAERTSFDKEYQYDEFEIGMLKLHVSYTDNMSRDIPVTDFMLSEKDLKKLESFGNPRITIEYEGFEIVETVHLIDLAQADKNLNKDNEYDCVIKAIRDNDTVIFYLDSYTELAALSFAYKYDNSIMQLSDPALDSKLTGIGKAEVKEGKVLFAYTCSDSTLNGENIVLFKVKLAGDFRTSGLAVDDTFDNVSYGLSDGVTTKLNNVLYHASTK